MALPVPGALCPTAFSHGFGQRFDLPLPLWLWVTGAGATILLSFVVMALFIRNTPGRAGYPRLNLLGFRAGGWLARPAVLNTLRGIAVLVFLATIWSGLFGTPDPFRNLAPTMVWVVWWVGFAFACALIGDLWALVNPLRSLFAMAEAGFARLSGGRSLSRQLPYPPRVGTWPAVVVFLCFAWVELVWLEGDVPVNLAVLLILYTAVNGLGMYLFGREVWLRNGEAFSVAFGILSRFAPLETRVTDRHLVALCPDPVCRHKTLECINGYWCLARAAPPTREWNLRPPAVGLLDVDGVSVSLMVFVLLALSTVTFDGLLETPLWLDITNRLLTTATLSPVFDAARVLGLMDFQLLNTIGLVTVPLSFFMIYLICNWVIARMTNTSVAGAETTRDTWTLAKSFILTLVPIAIAYHLAHYLSMLLISGQFIIPLVSDPMGIGWDLFGTAGYKVNLSIIGARFVWYYAAIAVVVGHVAAVYLAHVVALGLFRDHRVAMWSQVPMVALMIAYTMVSLWILAQPIVA